MINQLKQKQYQLLKDTGNQDIADKVNEIVDYLNKPKERKPAEISLESVAEAIFDADTLYDAKEILFDYVKKLK